MQPSFMNNNNSICSNHEECEGRSSQIKLTKGFTAKESVKGHMASSFQSQTQIHSFLIKKPGFIEPIISSFCNKQQLDIAH